MHAPITQESIDTESYAFLSDPYVKAYVERLKASGKEFHIGFDLAERFTKPALRALTESARGDENNKFLDGYRVICETKDEELSGKLTPSTEGGCLRFSIYLDGKDAPKRSVSRRLLLYHLLQDLA